MCIYMSVSEIIKFIYYNIDVDNNELLAGSESSCANKNELMKASYELSRYIN